MLFKKFTIKIGGNPVEVDKGLTDAYIEKSTQLAECENRDGYELITLASSYKKYRVHKWKAYQREKARPRSLDYDMSRLVLYLLKRFCNRCCLFGSYFC